MERVSKSVDNILGANFNQKEQYKIKFCLVCITWSIEQHKRDNYDTQVWNEFTRIKKIEILEPYINHTLFEKISEIWRSIDELSNLQSNMIGQINDIYLDFMKEDDKRFIELINYIGSTGNYAHDVTPVDVNRVIKQLLKSVSMDSIIDFCSGNGGIAIQQLHHKDNVKYQGIEINKLKCIVAEILLEINEVNFSNISNKDVLKVDVTAEFDVSIAHFPTIEFDKSDIRLQDFPYGLPRRTHSDWLFCQKVILSLNDSGIGIAIGTKGVLTRSYDEEIRSRIIDEDLIECIITLPANMNVIRGVETALIVFNKSKRESRKEKILFIDISDKYVRVTRNQYGVTEEALKIIDECYNSEKYNEQNSILVSNDNVRDNASRLYPKEYLVAKKQTKDKFTSLQSAAEVIRGLDTKPNDSTGNVTHFLLTPKELEGEFIRIDPTNKINPSRVDHTKMELKENDIVITTKGSQIKAVFIDQLDERVICSGNLAIIRVNEEGYNASFLYEYLISNDGKEVLESIQTGTTVKFLSVKQLAQISIPLIDAAEMRKLGNKMAAVRKQYKEMINHANDMMIREREKLYIELEI